MSREERVAECKEEKLSEEERVFSLGWVSGNYAEWPSLFGSMLIFNRCRIVRPNGHFFICSMLMFSGCRAVRPNGYFLFIVQLGHSEWPSLLCCSMCDVQRVLSGPAEWPFFFFLGSMLMFSGCRAIRSNGYFLFIAQLGHAE